MRKSFTKKILLFWRLGEPKFTASHGISFSGSLFILNLHNHRNATDKKWYTVANRIEPLEK